MEIVRKFLHPRKITEDVAPSDVDFITIIAGIANSFPPCDLLDAVFKSYIVGTGIEIHRQFTVRLDNMHYRCIEVGHRIAEVIFLRIRKSTVIDGQEGYAQGIEPTAAKSDIERSASGNNRSFKLQASIKKSDIE